MAILAIAVSHKTQHGKLPHTLAVERSMVSGEPVEVQGQILYPIYNRILFPFAFSQLAKLAPPEAVPHLFVGARFVAFAACFFLMFASIDARAARSGANAMATCLVTGIAFTMTVIHHPEPVSSDILDLMIMYFAFLYLMEGRIVIAFVLACLTAVNRETGAFAGIAYFLLRAGNERPVRLLATSAALTLIPFVLAIAVRRMVFQGEIPAATLGQWMVGLPVNLATMATDVLRFNPANNFYVLAATIGLPALLLICRDLPSPLKVRVFASCIAIFIVSLMFGMVREIRVFMPCISLLLAATVANFAGPVGRTGSR